MVIGFIVGLAALEIDITPLLAAVGAAGFVVGFALQGTLSNFASGLLILAYRPFDVGDVIEAAGVSGSVDSVSLFSTHVRTFDNKLMIVPNNDIWGGTITNATASDTRRVDLVFGIGYGWNHEEMENHGIEVRTRRELVREKILAMRSLWTQEVAEFHGQWIDMEPAWQWPKPVQQPGPPNLIGGGAGPKLFAHIAEFGDGWMPIGGSGMRESLEQLREAMAAHGRDPDNLRIVPMGVLPDEI